jgi:mannose-6-phosphate isomerase-like protein (cupin superfamily)
LSQNKNQPNMERRNFLQNAGIFAALGMLPTTELMAHQNTKALDGANNLKPFLLPPTQPLAHNGTMAIRTWVRSTMTGGVYSCVECAVAPKIMGPPPHLHKELDELMFVLEGTASVMVENEEVQIPAGGWHFRPRNLRHTFWNASDQPLRFVDMYFNQPFEEFLERVFYELTPEKGYPFGSPQRDREHNILNEKFGLVYAPTAGEERQAIAAKYGLK